MAPKATSIETDEDDLEYLMGMARVADGRVILGHSERRRSCATAVLFGVATSKVKILAPDVSALPYASPRVVAAAVEYLERNPDAVLTLAGGGSPDAWRPAREAWPARVAFVPLDLTKPVSFAVADAAYLRFEAGPEESSIIVFGGDDPSSARRVDALHDTLIAVG